MNGTPPDKSEQMGHVLLGFADLLELLVLKLREFGSELIAQTKYEHPQNKR
jgi:hypothetical protein